MPRMAAGSALSSGRQSAKVGCRGRCSSVQSYRCTRVEKATFPPDPEIHSRHRLVATPGCGPSPGVVGTPARVTWKKGPRQTQHGMARLNRRAVMVGASAAILAASDASEAEPTGGTRQRSYRRIACEEGFLSP